MRDGVDALTDVNLAIWRGELASIDGPSGSGKSTLLSILRLTVAPTTGQCLLSGQDVHAMGAADRRAHRQIIGFISSEAQLDDSATVYQNIAASLSPPGGLTREHHAHIESILDCVGLLHAAARMPGTLSCGQRIAVALANALASRPSILLADDPFIDLEEPERRICLDALTRMRREGLAVCLAAREPCAVVSARRFRLVAGHLNQRVAEDIWWI